MVTADQIARFQKLDFIRLEGTGDAFTAAWDAARLASELEPDPDARGMALAWMVLRTAEACDRILESQGRTSAADTGETASDRIRKYLTMMARTILLD